MDNKRLTPYEVYHKIFEEYTEKAGNYFADESLSDSEKTNVLLYIQIRMLANFADMMFTLSEDRLR